jgi:uncharacterized membrane protein YedE/YeeE
MGAGRGVCARLACGRGGGVGSERGARDRRHILAAAADCRLVGFRTRLGNGCTSGHGVCGLARLSRRSIGATATFMIAGVATVFVARHLVGGS